MTGSIGWLVAASAVLIVSHVLLSGTALRGRIVAAIGEGPFRAVFSVISLAALVWVAAAYDGAPHIPVWTSGHALKGITWLVMLPAVCLVVCGVSSPNPTAIGREGLLEKGLVPRGVFTVTRHPVMWGIALWAIAHCIANGDVASLVMFGGFLLLVLAGLASQERKKRTRYGDAWQGFAAATSFVPFVAALQGRTRIDHRGIGWPRIAATFVVYALLVVAHPFVIGVSPIP